jgi:hypothetical protein
MLIEMSSMKNEKLLCSVSRQSCQGLSMNEDVSHQNRRMFQGVGRRELTGAIA